MCNNYKRKIIINENSGEEKKEVADVLNLYGSDYIKKHPLPKHYLKIIHDITICRTQYLGGHVFKCNSCGYEKEMYNSCRNRHCPKCQFTARLKWVEKRKSEVLGVGYFHIVFTLPHELNPLALSNKNVCLNILFKSVSETLTEFGWGELKGQIGFIAILHTWSQTLLDHFHIHCVIPAGVISQDKKKWFYARENFMFSVKAMSKMFRGKYIDYLKESYINGEIISFKKIGCLTDKIKFRKFVGELWGKKWVVYAKKPFSDPQAVLKYLSCYTHRVAIANHRIISIDNGYITFRYKDRKNGNIDKEMTLSAEEFIRRFLLHVLPDKFMKIRYYGFLGNRNRKANVRLCCKLMGSKSVEVVKENILKLLKDVIGIDITKCPKCNEGNFQRSSRILSYTERKLYYDTS